MIESVLITSGKRRTACLSTQIGCKFGCIFCMSGSNGFVRNCDTSEIIDQLYIMQHDLGKPLTNVVVMGMGEPFDNYDELMRALRIMNSTDGFHIGARHITISTVGLPQKIDQFAREGMDQMKLAISLHAARDTLRSEIMPANKQYPLETLIEALLKNRNAFKRRITFEYVLLSTINDTPEDAKALAQLARQVKAKINLIPFNKIEKSTKDDCVLQPSSHKRVQEFIQTLQKHNVLFTIRKSSGGDVAAACGQLSCKNNTP